MQKQTDDKLPKHWSHVFFVSPMKKVTEALMGARAIYNVPSKARSDSLTNNGAIISSKVNGLNKEVMIRSNYEDQLQQVKCRVRAPFNKNIYSIWQVTCEELEVNNCNPTFFGAPLSASTVPRPSRLQRV